MNASLGETAGIWQSADGLSWSRIETISKGYKSLDFGNEWFVAGGPKGAVAISADGIVWDFPRFPIIEDFVGNGASFTARHASANQITFYDGRFYALARQNGWGNVMVVSDDGLDWERGMSLGSLKQWQLDEVF